MAVIGAFCRPLSEIAVSPHTCIISPLIGKNNTLFPRKWTQIYLDFSGKSFSLTAGESRGKIAETPGPGPASISRCGGIGRHKGLKIPRPNRRTGSTPVSGTRKVGTPYGGADVPGIVR